MKTALKIVVRVAIDLIIIITAILAYTIWQNSENKQYEKYLTEIQSRSEIKIDDIDSIVIEEGLQGPGYPSKAIHLSRQDLKYAFVLEELSWILKRKPDSVHQATTRFPPDFNITLRLKNGTPVREFKVYHIELSDIKTKASYTFYMAYRIKEWIAEMHSPEVK